MLKNYLKIAWRNLTRNKSYAFINIGGLAIALAVCIIIVLFVRHELNYDSFFSDSDQIYRVAMIDEDATSNGTIHLQIPEPIAGDLKKLYPEVDQSVRITGPYDDVLLKGKNKVYCNGWAEAGNSYFNIFDFPFIAGSPSTALEKPQSVVITQKLARELFDTNEAIGKSITYNNGAVFTVTGIIKNLPDNTHFKIEAFAYRDAFSNQQWNYYTNSTYIKIKKGIRIAALQAKLPTYVQSHKLLPEGMKADYRLLLQPVSDIHMHPQTREAGSSRMFYIRILLIVAGLILLVACINYMNLSTARSAQRSREIGIRKTIGANRKQVILQIMMESGITCFFAFLISLLLVELFMPLSLHYFGITIGAVYQFTPGWIVFLFGLILFVSLLSGSYAAFYLSSFQPTDVLKGTGSKSGRGAAAFRKMLVVSQFCISIVIVILSLLISKQMEFVRTERLNGNDEQVMVIKNNSKTLSHQFQAFKNQLLNDRSIASVSAGTIPTQIGSTSGYSDSTGHTTTVYNFYVEYDYLKTIGLTLVNGRTFNPERSQDIPASVLLTQSYAKKLGFEHARGQEIIHTNKKLIGIINDFHSQTLFNPINPVMISLINLNNTRITTILVRLKKGQISEGINHIQTVWEKFVPAYPLNFSFLDQVLDQDYRAELRLVKIFNVFSVFAILIACLGLFGLAAFSAQRRTKEIGVRKVLGATVVSIIGLLSKDFLKLVALGFIIAAPIGWYAMHRWLQSFAYKIDIGPGIFLLAGGLALLVALATVSWQSIRAALANPVDSLRSE